MGINIGDEQDGKGASFARPILVLKKFNSNIFLGIPLSTKVKDNPHYLPTHFKGIQQCFVLSQIKLIDARRFENKMGAIPTDELAQVKKKLVSLIL